MTRLLCLFLFAPLLLAAAPPAAPARPLFPAAELEQQPIATVILFHPKPPTLDVQGEAKALLAGAYKGLKQVASAEELKASADAAVLVEALPPEAITPITEEQLRYFARGFDAAQAKQLVGAKQATVLLFTFPRAKRFEALKEATGFSHALAERLGSFLLDAETRQYFTAAEWKRQRLDTWKSQVPFLAEHVSYHLYPTDRGLRVVSLGMGKFGLPDVVVEQLSRALSTPMGLLLNASTQLIAEGNVPDASGAFVVALERIKEPRAKAQLLAELGPKAKRRTQLRAVQAQREEGDPDNALMELSFPGSEGTLEQRQMARLVELLGTKPQELSQVRANDAELARVAKKARERLTQLRPTLSKGLPSAARLSIKASFPTDDGSIEWMWFELSSWKGDMLSGNLLNEPRAIRGLRLGSIVEVHLERVADYLYRPGDGTEEGNESGRILMKRQGK